MTIRNIAAVVALSLFAFPVAAQLSPAPLLGRPQALWAVLSSEDPLEPSWAASAGQSSGGLSDEQRPRFREYSVRERRPSYRYQEEVRFGAVLPSSGVTYYEVPAEYGVRDYRYTVVNDRTVLVDPRTHRVIQIVE